MSRLSALNSCDFLTLLGILDYRTELFCQDFILTDLCLQQSFSGQKLLTLKCIFYLSSFKTSAYMIEEELKEKLRKKQEALKHFQRQVKRRVNQQIRLRKKQQFQRSYEAVSSKVNLSKD